MATFGASFGWYQVSNLLNCAASKKEAGYSHLICQDSCLLTGQIYVNLFVYELQKLRTGLRIVLIHKQVYSYFCIIRTLALLLIMMTSRNCLNFS